MFVEWTNKLLSVFRRFAAEPPATLSEIYPGFRSNDAMPSVKPAIVGCHFGLPTPDQVAALKGSGCRLRATATLAPKGRRSWTALLPVPPWTQAPLPCNAT